MATDGFADVVEREADSYVAVYLHGRELGQPTTLEQKALIESIVATDYEGRVLIELLQNAHDAHERRARDGQILIRFDESRSEHGVLVVANGGRPFNAENFRAICRVALSSKPPEEGIGNKGVGFKSVLQLSSSPTIYSMAATGSECFDGFCFRFAGDADFDEIAQRVRPAETGLGDELRRNVSPLKLPVPIAEVPSALRELPSEGYVTAVELEIRSASAGDLTRRMIDDLVSASVPVHLFPVRPASDRRGVHVGCRV